MSSLRSRQQKRKATVLHGKKHHAGVERPALEHGVRNEFGLSWRTVSGLIVVSLLVVLAVFFLSGLFYVRSVSVFGATYLDETEVFRYADIAEVHLFWIDPEKVRQNIVDASSVIADARVTVRWPVSLGMPPNVLKTNDMVQIHVEERKPALLWIQSGVVALVDVQGRVLRFPPDSEAYPDLLPVFADASMEGPPGLDSPIPVDAVTGALQLRTLLVGLPLLRYHPVKGLGFEEESWSVWLGVGTNMPNKLVIYETLRDNLLTRGITPTEINVAHPEAAYYCGSVELCDE